MKRKALPKELRLRVLAKTNGKCGYCGNEHPRMQIDHMKPMCDGGTDDFDNLIAACPQCNNYKCNADVETLRTWVSRIPMCRNGHDLAISSGVIIVTGNSPEFYFEKLRRETC